MWKYVQLKEKKKKNCAFVFINEAVVPTIFCEGGLCETEYFRAKAEFLSESQKVKVLNNLKLKKLI